MSGGDARAWHVSSPVVFPKGLFCFTCVLTENCARKGRGCRPTPRRAQHTTGVARSERFRGVFAYPHRGPSAHRATCGGPTRSNPRAFVPKWPHHHLVHDGDDPRRRAAGPLSRRRCRVKGPPKARGLIMNDPGCRQSEAPPGRGVAKPIKAGGPAGRAGWTARDMEAMRGAHACT